MQKQFIVYSFHNSEKSSNEIIKYLYEMKAELEKHDLPMNDYDIVDGNSKFPETKLFLEQSFKKNDDKIAIDCDKVREKIHIIEIPFLQFSQFRQIKRAKEYLDEKGKIDKTYKNNFFSIFKSEIGQFWKSREEYNFPDSFDDDDFFNTIAQQFYNSVHGDILIIADRKFKKIVGENVVSGAHGVRMIGNRGNGVVLYIKAYKNIIWHEAAHLLGAKDHYNLNSDGHEAIQDCLNPKNCVMQWNAGDTFCEKCIDEIRTYLT